MLGGPASVEVAGDRAWSEISRTHGVFGRRRAFAQQAAADPEDEGAAGGREGEVLVMVVAAAAAAVVVVEDGGESEGEGEDEGEGAGVDGCDRRYQKGGRSDVVMVDDRGSTLAADEAIVHSLGRDWD